MVEWIGGFPGGCSCFPAIFLQAFLKGLLQSFLKKHRPYLEPTFSLMTPLERRIMHPWWDCRMTDPFTPKLSEGQHVLDQLLAQRRFDDVLYLHMMTMMTDQHAGPTDRFGATHGGFCRWPHTSFFRLCVFFYNEILAYRFGG